MSINIFTNTWNLIWTHKSCCFKFYQIRFELYSFDSFVQLLRKKMKVSSFCRVIYQILFSFISKNIFWNTKMLQTQNESADWSCRRTFSAGKAYLRKRSLYLHIWGLVHFAPFNKAPSVWIERKSVIIQVEGFIGSPSEPFRAGMAARERV